MKKKYERNKKIIIPIVVFLLGICALGGIVYGVECSQQKHNMETAKLNAMTYAERMKNEIIEQIDITNTLQQILISEGGTINRFDKVAEKMMTDSVQSIQIAPNGVVTDIYPEEGNEASKIDLLNDKDRGEISRYARDQHMLVLQGPFELKQGGYGMAIRNPVYLEDENDEEYFWGFTIVIIRVPDIFSESEQALANFGYQYRLSKTVSPWDTTYKEVYCSGEEIVHPASYNFEVGGEQWRLDVMPKGGWLNNGQLYIVLGAGIWIVLLLTGLTGAWVNLVENRKNLQRMAITDSLTGIYNRKGFDEQVVAYMKKNPMKPCVAAQFDVDDFKLINDMYGHASGDRALQCLAENMRSAFPDDAVLGRNGGDEFCVFLPDCTGEDAKERMKQFAEMPKTFSYGEEEYAFSISIGYAEYPTYAKNRAQLMRCADAALYEVKLHGKNGCMAYREGLQLEVRKQLGFALKDVSMHLPGAFIIYRADKEDDEIYFVNRELLRLAGCDTQDEFLAYSKNSFRNLIREDEQEMIENSIWEQIDSGHNNDYIYFHMKKADGTYVSVLDHGRIVNNSRYGSVFYVLIMDWEAMQQHYSDKIHEIRISDKKLI